MLQKLVDFLLPTASAQADLKDGEGDKWLTDPTVILSFISIVLGMIAKILFDVFRKRRSWIGFKGLAVRMLPSLVISPIVFQAFIRTADIVLQDELSLLAVCLFAFQNGFFWEDVLNMEQAARVRQSTQKPKPAGAILSNEVREPVR